MPLDLTADTVTLTEQLVNIFSVSLDEKEIADRWSGPHGHRTTSRSPAAATPSSPAPTSAGTSAWSSPATSTRSRSTTTCRPAATSELLHGLGSCDMKAGVAVALKLAAELTEPNRDVTYIFYEAEEIEAEHNGLSKLSESDPDLMRADFAILMEPSNAVVEAGCQGTMRVDVRLGGERAHSARSWMGDNAIHKAGAVLRLLDGYEARTPVIDGLEYHEGLNAVFIKGGVAGNVIPDECVIEVNYRFAPDRDEAEAEAFLREFFAGYDVTVTDAAPGALPGLAVPAAAGVRRGRRRRGEPEVRLDRRGPLHRPRRPGGELRAR